MSFFNSPSFTMPAGQYYIGDLCYVLNDRWSQVCDKTIEGQSVKEGKFTLPDGTEFIMFSTAYGDGTYHANGVHIGVDSGSIGCVKVSDIDSTDKTNLIGFGTVVTFTQDFFCTNTKGYMKFGHVEINTQYLDDEDDVNGWGDEDGDGWGDDD